MKIKLSWESIGEIRVLHYEFQPSWTWEDFFEAKTEADAMLEDASENVPLIFDLRLAPNMPPGMLLQSRVVAESRHPKGSPVILLGANGLIQATFEIVKRMLGERTEQFTQDVVVLPTWEDAASYLQNRKTT